MFTSIFTQSIYIIQFLHAGRISLTPPRARHWTQLKLVWRKLVTLTSACAGRNYNLFMYKCCFLACFCASQCVQRRKAELTLAQILEKLPNGWADWHQISTHVQIHMGMDIRQKQVSLETQGGTWGSTIQKYWEAVRLPPTLVHVCGFIWECT